MKKLVLLLLLTSCAGQYSFGKVTDSFSKEEVASAFAQRDKVTSDTVSEVKSLKERIDKLEKKK